MQLVKELGQRRNLLIVAGCVAFIQIACYYLAGMTVRDDGAMAIAQPDTLLYCQAARRIVEGAPFSYSAGTAASTGTTSVLYPFLLAVPCALGCAGDLLLAAGFALNAAFYFAFLLGWCMLACRMFEERPYSRILSVALLASFGPFAYCSLAQSDIGLWLAVSAWLAYGLASGDRRIYVPLLLLAPWIRPEGMIIAFSFCAFCALDAVRRRKVGVDLLVAALSAVSVAGVFALNYAITGECQFSSVAHKGYFKNLSLCSAVYASAIDLMRIVKAYLLGIPQNAPRDFFFVPLVGAAFMWIGVFARSWREVGWREFAWYLAMFGGMATVATSGWQGTNLDRYLAWILPAILLFMAYGAEVVARLATSRQTPDVGRCQIVSIVPAAVLLVFSCGMSIVFLGIFRHSCIGADPSRAFAVRCETAMPAGASLGTWGDAGVSFSLSDRRLAHLSGIYSPEFMGSSAAAKVEILKNEPATRFDYWFCKTSEREAMYCGKPDVMAGETVLTGPPGFELRKTDWRPYDAALIQPDATLAAVVDVAYERSEKACGYEPLPMGAYPLFAPFHAVGKLNGTNIVEGGRFLLGGDAMTVALKPGKDVRVVMRTALKCSVAVERELGHERSDFSLKSPMHLRVMVDGMDAGDVEFQVKDGDFADAAFVIPGRFVTQPVSRIAFLGEHVAFCYCFFQ